MMSLSGDSCPIERRNYNFKQGRWTSLFLYIQLSNFLFNYFCSFACFNFLSHFSNPPIIPWWVDFSCLFFFLWWMCNLAIRGNFLRRHRMGSFLMHTNTVVSSPLFLVQSHLFFVQTKERLFRKERERKLCEEDEMSVVLKHLVNTCHAH